MRKPFLLLALLSSAAAAQVAPPANVPMENGTNRATTPAPTFCYDSTQARPWVPCPVPGTTYPALPATAVTVFAASVNSVRAAPAKLTAWQATTATNGTAGCLVVYDSATAPAVGSTLTPSLVRWTAVVGLGSTVPMQYAQPLTMQFGLQLVFTANTACTTYTAPATAPVSLTGAYQ